MKSRSSNPSAILNQNLIRDTKQMGIVEKRNLVANHIGKVMEFHTNEGKFVGKIHGVQGHGFIVQVPEHFTAPSYVRVLSPAKFRANVSKFGAWGWGYRHRFGYWGWGGGWWWWIPLTALVAFGAAAWFWW